MDLQPYFFGNICFLQLLLNTYAGDLAISVDTSQDQSTASSYARSFSNSVAKPLMASFPRSYSSYGVAGQVELSGFSTIENFDLQKRNLFKESVMAIVNETMQSNHVCCASYLHVTITNVCSSDLTSCESYMVPALPSECGDGKRIDPEQATRSLATVATAATLAENLKCVHSMSHGSSCLLVPGRACQKRRRGFRYRYPPHPGISSHRAANSVRTQRYASTASSGQNSG